MGTQTCENGSPLFVVAFKTTIAIIMLAGVTSALRAPRLSCASVSVAATAAAQASRSFIAPAIAAPTQTPGTCTVTRTEKGSQARGSASAADDLPSSVIPADELESLPSIYDQGFTFRAIDGQPLPLMYFTNKPLLVVNVASECGLTPQYVGLEALWQDWKGKGLIVLGVPCNDFGGQEPGTDEEVYNFATSQYGATFPLTSKEAVLGDHAHSLYLWMERHLGEASRPTWNFQKYLFRPK